jgi:hypothetical protein
MVRVLKTADDAKKWIDEALEFKGNSFMSAEQQKAVADAMDVVYGLMEEHGIHPFYVIGMLSSLENAIYDDTSRMAGEAARMAGLSW